MRSDGRWIRMCSAATSTSATERTRLEDQLRSAPDSVELRVKLVGADYRDVGAEAQRRRAGHLTWLAEHHPQIDLSGFAFVPALDCPDEHAMVKHAWGDAIARHPDDLRVLEAGGSFLSFCDPELAVDVYRRAVHLEPEDSGWRERLGRTLSKLARWSGDEIDVVRYATEAVRQLELALELLGDESKALGLRIELARTRGVAREWERAALEAERVLREAEAGPRTFEYGNAIHWANIVLGGAAMARNDLDVAVRALEAAGETPGSPQLNSFGPDFELASALLDGGQTAAVLAYLEACTRFWKNPQVTEWRQAIERGESPWREDGDDADVPVEPA